MPLVRKVSGLYYGTAALLNSCQSPLLLAIRLFWGWQFAESGWGKLHRIPQVTDFFTSLGLPQPHITAIFVALVEFVGGILFALGLGSRVISLILFINMSVAFLTADKDAVSQIFSDPSKFLAADPFLFWFAALIVLIFGPGFLALDTLLARIFGEAAS